MNYDTLDRLDAAQCQLHKAAKEIGQIALDCCPDGLTLQKAERERNRHQERANKYAIALHTLIEAAQNVADRWDNPLLAKDMHHIIALRKAIEEAKK